MTYRYFPNEFSSYEDYVKYLKEKGFALEAPEGMHKKEMTKNIGDVERIRYDSLNYKNIILKWSKEDEQILDKIITALMHAENVDCADYNIMYNWLKSLKQRMEE